MMGMRLSQSVDLRLSLFLMCKVCRLPLKAEENDATLFIASEAYRVNAAAWLKAAHSKAERPHDPFVICPGCGTTDHDCRERNYRRRARTFIRRYENVTG